jgi:hypothetical protein
MLCAIISFLISICIDCHCMQQSHMLLRKKRIKPMSVSYKVSEENVIKTLSYLASDELEGRDSGSEGIEKAAVYLRKSIERKRNQTIF